MFSPGSSKIHASEDDDEEIEMRPDIEDDREFKSPQEDEEYHMLLQQSLDEAPARSRELDQQQLKFLLKQVAINRRYDRWQSFFTYEYFKESMKWFLDSATCDFSFTFEDVTLAMTLFVLFADDIKILCSPSEYDYRFSVAYAVCFFTFIFEFVGNTWSKTVVTSVYPKFEYAGYMFTFFWWLDLLAILSLFPDVIFIGRPMGIASLSNSTSGQSNYTKAGRVVRLVRLVRLIKVYKVASERRRRVQQDEELLELVRIGAIEESELAKQRGLYNQRQSRLGDELAESTTRRVIILILLVLILIPVLMYTPTNHGPEFATKFLHEFNTDQTGVTQAAKQAVLYVYVDQVTDNLASRYVPFLDITMAPFNPYISFPSYLSELRSEQKQYEYYSTTIGATTYVTDAIYSLQEYARSQAVFSIVTTIFVAIILVGAALVFANDAEILVIAPIKRMMNMVEAVAADPLKPLHFHHNKDGDQMGEYEMHLLETTIEKITGLLRVGFGEAGAGIISANLANKDSSTAINPLLPGVRIYAIFGFCDIHHFEDINRKLANDVLVFVNHIAEIVHSSVHTWSGQCNKNLGNAFVIVWRIGDENMLSEMARGTRGRAGSGGGGGGNKGSAKKNAGKSSKIASGSNDNVVPPPPTTPHFGASTKGSVRKGGIKSSASNDSLSTAPEVVDNAKKRQLTVDLRRVPGVDILADQALIGYCKIIAEINRNKYVMRYRNEPRLTEKGKHEFKVRMGFGLHAGWAIEGAVGSLQKVDATYLSPHVNMAARLETSSKQYGVPLLASQDFYDLMSNEGQAVMRRLDVVTVKGSEVPIGIYTYDALQDQYFREDRRNQRPSGQGQSMSVKESLVLSNAALAAISIKANHHNGHSGANGASTKVSPTASGTSTPQRRPSISIIPGLDKPAVFLTPDDHTGDVFEQDYDMLTLRKHATDPEFLSLFKEGIKLYLAGDWAAAKTFLERADLFMRESAPILGGDGPSKTLLSYMSNQNFEAPKSWKGYRPLTSK